MLAPGNPNEVGIRAFSLLSGLTALAWIFSCTPNSREAPQTPPPSPTLSLLRIENSSEPNGDPIHDWLRDLEAPRLSTLPGLSWECAPNDPTSVIVKLDLSKFSCHEVIVDSSGPSPTVECLGDDRMRVRTLRDRCNPQREPQVLGLLRAPADRGFFRHKDTQWIPNPESHTAVTGGLVPFEISSAETANLKRPTAKAWLASASTQGAVRLSLQMVGSSTRPPSSEKVTEAQSWSSLASLKAILERIAAPKLFRPDPNYLFPPPKQVSAAASKNPFVVIKHHYRDPLFAGVCEYIDKWVKAGQIQAGWIPEEGKIAEFNCTLTWNDKPATTPGLVLTFLPLPLMVPENGTFPVKNTEEARSLAVLQSLKFIK